MTGLIILILLIQETIAQNSTLFLKTKVPGDFSWSNHVFKIENLKSSVIECGATCMIYNDCELYTLDDATNICYLATLSVPYLGPNLPSTPNSTHGYIDKSKFSMLNLLNHG